MKPLAVEIVVADAGPLIALARLQLLDLPIRLFRRIVITQTVLAECDAKPDRGEGAAIKAAINAGWMAVCDDPTPEHHWGLDSGETSAIACAVALGAGVLMDEKAGRTVARQLGCPVIGTAGLLVLAKRRRLLPKVRPQLERLRASGYFLSASLVAETLRLAEEG